MGYLGVCCIPSLFWVFLLINRLSFSKSSLFPGSDLVHFYFYFFVNLGDYIVLQGRLKKASTLLAEVDRRCRFVGRSGWEHDDGGASQNKRINNKCEQDHMVGLLAITPVPVYISMCEPQKEIHLIMAWAKYETNLSKSLTAPLSSPLPKNSTHVKLQLKHTHPVNPACRPLQQLCRRRAYIESRPGIFS